MSRGTPARLFSVLTHGTQRRFFRRILSSPASRRYALEWVRSTEPGYLMDVPSPWIVFGAIDWLKGHLGRGSRVFEYGSGGSTLFFLSLGASCVSIEHDPEWYRLVRARIPQTPSLDYRLVPPEPAGTGEESPGSSDPGAYRSDDVKFAGCSFRNYVTQIDAFPDACFDVVLVDGRARPSCIVHGVAKVKVGGALVLDNAERDYYTREVRSFLDGYEVKRFEGPVPSLTGFSATDIYTRVR